MLLKIVGGILLIIAGTMTGFELSKDYVERIKQLNSIQKFILILSGEIKYNNSGIKNALERSIKTSRDTISEFVGGIINDMNENSKMSVREIWEQQVSENLKLKSKLNENDIEQFKELGEGLGTTDRETQIKKFELYMEKIEMDLAQAQKNKESKCRIYKTLGIAAGIFVTVLMI